MGPEEMTKDPYPMPTPHVQVLKSLWNEEQSKLAKDLAKASWPDFLVSTIKLSVLLPIMLLVGMTYAILMFPITTIMAFWSKLTGWTIPPGNKPLPSSTGTTQIQMYSPRIDMRKELEAEIAKILRNEDIEGLISSGAPENEYDSLASDILIGYLDIACTAEDWAKAAAWTFDEHFTSGTTPAPEDFSKPPVHQPTQYGTYDYNASSFKNIGGLIRNLLLSDPRFTGLWATYRQSPEDKARMEKMGKILRDALKKPDPPSLP